ncbi:MAG: cyclic nucleotide-binding domain-containing protein [SAR324 cluster bacterium]|jgi:hemerythrin|nr:cyclic nucleotide-binding domain-containing protein [SAR324 cluster bacterium]|tara:strand:+ start:26069 stop:28276 length:2208 start_codon:yes stop_codon:yes gene_type:complete
MIESIFVSPGVHWVSFPEANLNVLCGCPADSVKHLMKKGLIRSIEKDGMTYESGPNAILLSDLKLQNGHFANLAEFPILQMLYRQGMLLPNHPNNTGAKPILIGREDLVREQMNYIFRGNYGLTSVKEIIDAGIDSEKAEEMMRLKLRFAFGHIHPSEKLLEAKIVDEGKTEISNGVEVSRLAMNVYRFEYQGESLDVDLNLKQDEDYETPFELELHNFKREYFSVVHTGEGDGWDVNRPCMASVLNYQGKIYLIDAGPNISHSLNAMGIDINEVEGIFHTHAHDDHFAGLTTLIRADHRIKYFATPLVRASVTHKLAALMSIEESSFQEFFDVHDLDFNTWNSINGLEVRPVFSPHPVETNILFFRTLWKEGYIEYAHLADIASFEVLEGMITEDQLSPGISKKMFEDTREDYLKPVHLKKIDIGGGLIHGKAEDFVEDGSEKIVLSHSSHELSNQQKMTGSAVSFGTTDVLIPGNSDYSMRSAYGFLKGYYRGVEESDINMLLNCGHQIYNAGTLLIHNNEVPKSVFLILTGTVEFIAAEDSSASILSSGSMVGDLAVLSGLNNFGTYRTLTHVDALTVPASLFKEFVNRNQLSEEIQNIQDTIGFFQKSWLFGESVSSPVKARIARKTELLTCPEGKGLPTDSGLILLKHGEIELTVSGDQNHLVQVANGDFWGEEKILSHEPLYKSSEAKVDSTLYKINEMDLLKEIPVVRWKLIEHWEKRRDKIQNSIRS